MTGEHQVLCLVHDDGHVAAVGAGNLTPELVTGMHDILTKVGVPGWHLQELPMAAALELSLERLGCPSCKIVMPCGCEPEHIIAGQCPHDTAAPVRQAAGSES